MAILKPSALYRDQHLEQGGMKRGCFRGCRRGRISKDPGPKNTGLAGCRPNGQQDEAFNWCGERKSRGVII